MQHLSQHQEKKVRQRHNHLILQVLDNNDRLREKEDATMAQGLRMLRGKGLGAVVFLVTSVRA
ncbi:hypothetical protein T05_10600 [Trichinella murrelli]|uniref:Uncharacterized protein n=1 Tax=Trichinella murrelli TaxID=144512 RepID=A0A0V0TRX0_9BILA|nr:hypothetical protein T05_10600 [Trichinella murrelli]